MPFPATTIANELLRQANAAGDPLTHMKLQKLVYLAHGWYMAFAKGKPLILESVEAWDYGPVIRELYSKFASYGRGPITSLYKTTIGSEEDWVVSEPMLPEESQDEREIVEGVWENYRPLTAYQLSAMTHEDGSPWDKARKNGQAVIPNEDIFDYFQQRAKAAT